MLENLINKDLLENLGIFCEEESAGPNTNLIHLEIFYQSKVTNIILIETNYDGIKEYYFGNFEGDYRKISNISLHKELTSKILNIKQEKNKVKPLELSKSLFQILWDKGYKDKITKLMS